MKYVCTCECYACNPQGRFQRYKRGEAVEFGAGDKVPVHFIVANSSGQTEEPAVKVSAKSSAVKKSK